MKHTIVINMKKLTLISFICCFLSSCVSSKLEEESIQKHYFYFDKNHPKMVTYGKIKTLRHLYDLDNYDPIIFIPYDSIVKELNIKKLKKYKVKCLKWLNNLTGKEADSFFIKQKPKKEYYLIEKRESNEVLYIRRVTFIQEYE